MDHKISQLVLKFKETLVFSLTIGGLQMDRTRSANSKTFFNEFQIRKGRKRISMAVGDILQIHIAITCQTMTIQKCIFNQHAFNVGAFLVLNTNFNYIVISFPFFFGGANPMIQGGQAPPGPSLFTPMLILGKNCYQ